MDVENEIDISMEAMESLLLTIEEYTEDPEMSLEALNAFNSIMKGVVTKVKSALGIRGLSPINPMPQGSINAAQKRLNKIRFTTMEEMPVRVPEAIPPKVTMTQFIDELSLALSTTADVKGRVLTPLLSWAANTISDPNFGDRVWLDSNVKTLDIKKVKVGLARVYSDKYGDDDAIRPLVKAYSTRKDFTACGEMINTMIEDINKIFDGRILSMSEEIAKHVNTISLANEERPVFEQTPPATLKRVSTLLFAAAEELEFLAILVMQVRAMSVSYADTAERMLKFKV